MTHPGDLAATLAAIDAANADDPNVLVVDGEEVPKELTHARMVQGWVEALEPEVDDLQLIAARAHHLRRWAVPRSDYPDGRTGYLKWRTDLKRRHADDVAAIMAEHGYGDDEIERVGAIVRKEGLRTDPAVQTHEDALCLVFLQTQLGPTAERLGDDKTVDVLVKTLKKMSPVAAELATGLDFTPAERALVERAVGRLADGDG